MEKPTFGPLFRAVMIGLTAVFTLYFAVHTSLDDMIREDFPHAWSDPFVWAQIAGFTLWYVAVAGWIAYRVVRERFPPKGVFVFPALAINPVGEAVMSLTGGLMLLVFPVIAVGVPFMRAEAAWEEAHGMSVPYSHDWVGQSGPLVILLPIALFLLLWRPIFWVAPGRGIVRYRIGGWMPWTQRFPQLPGLAWSVWYGGGRYRYPVGHMLQGVVGKKTFDVEMVGLEWPESEKERIRGQWYARFAGA